MKGSKACHSSQGNYEALFHILFKYMCFFMQIYIFSHDFSYPVNADDSQLCYSLARFKFPTALVTHVALLIGHVFSGP